MVGLEFLGVNCSGSAFVTRWRAHVAGLTPFAPDSGVHELFIAFNGQLCIFEVNKAFLFVELSIALTPCAVTVLVGPISALQTTAEWWPVLIAHEIYVLNVTARDLDGL